MPKLYVKTGGAWKQVLRLWVKQSGAWKDVVAGLVEQGGVGKQFYPDSVVTTTYGTPGTYSWTVPNGVTSVAATIVGAGGGGGGQFFDGSVGSGGGGGGSGGYYANQIISVTPGQVISIVVGAGGNGSGYNSVARGDSGGSSSFGATTATGGQGGTCAFYPPGQGGVGGSPNGVAGANGGFGSFSGGAGGNNITGYGKGGNGGGNSAGGKGANGFVQVRSLITIAYGDTIVNTSTGTRSGQAYSFTVPLGVYSVVVNAAGGGGGAYAYHDGGYCQHAWAGGPGGGVSDLIIPVVPGDVISGVYGSAGGSGYYNGGIGGPGSATTINKNGSLVATCGPGGQNTGGGAPSPGTSTITSGYSGTTTVGTVQTSWLNGCDGGYPSANHYDPWSWVFGGSYPQSVLGTVAKQAPPALGTSYQRAGMPQVCGFVSITY